MSMTSKTLGAAALVLTQTFPAAAQSDNGPYAVSRECAIGAFQQVVGPQIEIVEGDGGVAGMYTVEPANGNRTHLSAVVALGAGGLVETIGVQLDQLVDDVEYVSAMRLDFARGSGELSSIAASSSNVLNDVAQSFVDHLDRALRDCQTPLLLGSVNPAPGPRLG